MKKKEYACHCGDEVCETLLKVAEGISGQEIFLEVYGSEKRSILLNTRQTKQLIKQLTKWVES